MHDLDAAFDRLEARTTQLGWLMLLTAGLTVVLLVAVLCR